MFYCIINFGIEFVSIFRISIGNIVKNLFGLTIFLIRIDIVLLQRGSNMGFNDFYNNHTDSNDNIPYFEDTHRMPLNVYNQQNGNENLFPDRGGENSPQRFEQVFGKKEPKNFQNLMVYEPRSEIDSKTIIDFIKRKEPAIINLDKADPAVSQRILDFVSGAVYALNGTVHRVSGNIFLLSPKGVEVTVPYEVEQ